jgi:hypothetical protein
MLKKNEEAQTTSPNINLYKMVVFPKDNWLVDYQMARGCDLKHHCQRARRDIHLERKETAVVTSV